MLGVGIGFIALSDLAGFDLIAEGVGFVLVGLAGMLVSWITFDIGAGIKEAIPGVGRQNKAAIDSLAESQNKMPESQDRMYEVMDRIAESQDRIAERLERVAENTRRSDRAG